MATISKKKFGQIEEKFEKTAFRLTQERSDFLLPQVIDFVSQKKWINIRPEYQRRSVWDVKKRSAFIESILLNIPIPTLFLFERELSRYEVMDGQQRISAVVDFYEGRYPLKGLEKWAELNGLRYTDLPDVLKRGLDRRRLSATVVVVDSAKAAAPGTILDNDVRKLVFERLNTGGQHLNAQELRNCLYAGAFNDLIVRLASAKRFRKIWEIHASAAKIDLQTKSIDDEITSAEPEDNKFYRRMLDCEIVLRFFAFSRPTKLKGSVRNILDECMEENANKTSADIRHWESRFNSRLALAEEIFGKETFRYRDQRGKLKLSRPLYDAVMIAIDSLWDNKSKLKQKRTAVVAEVNGLLRKQKAFAVIVGRPNTAQAIQQRINIIKHAIQRACQ